MVPSRDSDELSPDDELVQAEVADAAAETTVQSGRRMLEVVLDPRSLQYLMALGAGLLVVGLVIWLAARGFFDDPLVVAVGCGAGNLALLACGAWLVRKTRFTLAGRGVLLLAAMLMPLHLWFYDAQGLIVLNEGGHLWIPALGIAVLYALCAVLIRDPLFVYAMVGGVTLTGLMILADQQVAKFYEGAATATLLVTLGLITLHAEKAFAPGTGPFSRQTFGRAFFRAGHTVLAAGLMVLVAWTISGWTYDGLLADSWRWLLDRPISFSEPRIAHDPRLQGLALTLTLVACYAYGYSYLAVSPKSGWVAAGLATLLWSELLAVDLLDLPLGIDLLVLMSGATGLAVVGLRYLLQKNAPDNDWPTGQRALTDVATAGLVAMPLVLGGVEYVRAVYTLLPAREIGWMFFVGQLLPAVVCGLGAWRSTQETSGNSANAWLSGAMGALLLAGFAALAGIGLVAWDVTGLILMGVPFAALLAARLVTGPRREAMTVAAHGGAALVLLLTLIAAAGLGLERRGAPVSGEHHSLLLALFLFEAGLFYLLAVVQTRQVGALYAAALCLVGGAGQLLVYHDVSVTWYLATGGLLGVATLSLQRGLRLERAAPPELATAVATIGHVLLSLSCAAALLLTVNRLVTVGFHGETFLLLLGLAGASLLGRLLTKQTGGRRWYAILGIGQTLAGLAMVGLVSPLALWQKLEVASLLAGAALLIWAHVGRVREQHEPTDRVTLGLVFGSLLMAGPVTLGLLAQRFGLYDATGPWSLVHELATLTAALLLVGSGILLRIKATTITGAASLLLYVVTLLVYVHLPETLQNVAIYMMLGGGAFFAVALLLSIYRDYLLSLPERARQRKGVFRVLEWR